MIVLSGSGVFEVADNGTIINNKGGGAIAALREIAVDVNGGTIESAGENLTPIYAENAIVTINGGNVPDVASNTMYSSAIFMLYRAGVLSGSNALGKLNPNSNMTRAGAAGIISKVILPGTRVKDKIYG